MNGITMMTLVSAMRMSSLSPAVRIVTIQHQTAFLQPASPWPAVLHAQCCSPVVGLGPVPPQPRHQTLASSQLCYPTLLQNVKVALRVQPPLVTEESDGFLLTQKEGESQKYKVSNCD